MNICDLTHDIDKTKLNDLRIGFESDQYCYSWWESTCTSQMV